MLYRTIPVALVGIEYVKLFAAVPTPGVKLPNAVCWKPTAVVEEVAVVLVGQTIVPICEVN